MGSSAVRLAYAVVAAAAIIAALGVAAPGPRRVNIRWSGSATLAERVATEQALGLQNPRALEAGTWSYEVPDVAIVQRILQQPLVDDTHYIDRDRLTFSPEWPSGRARVRRLYQSAPFAAIASHWRMSSGALVIVALALAWSRLRSMHRLSPDRTFLAAIVALSLVARIALVLAGGQHYWPDEARYSQGQQMVADLTVGDVNGAWSRAVTSGHPLFKIIAMLPATFEAQYGRDPRIPATFFALFSVLNVWLLARIARRLDATPLEAVWVALFAAASTSFLVYSRHLFPYDLALTFGLLALYAGVSGSGNWRASVACGLWAACAFLAYFGSWTFGASACAVHVFDGSSLRAAVRRSLLTGAGLAIPMLATIGVSELTGEDFFLRLRDFSAQVTQGSFEEGWRLPLEYLWHTEHILVVVWLAAVAWCVVGWRSWWTNRVVRSGLIGIAGVYGALAALSTGMHLFVVYGRLSRQLVPYFCLVAAPVAVRAFGRHPRLQRSILTALGAAVIAQAAFNAGPAFSQRFPAEFIVEGEQFAGHLGASRAVAIYARHLYPPARVEPPPGFAEVMSARHPLQFVPYQYEGFDPEQRRFLRSTDIRMRLLIPAGEKREEAR